MEIDEAVGHVTTADQWEASATGRGYKRRGGRVGHYARTREKSGGGRFLIRRDPWTPDSTHPYFRSRTEPQAPPHGTPLLFHAIFRFFVEFLALKVERRNFV